MPPASTDLQATDLAGRRVLFPYFVDMTTFDAEARIYHRVKDIIDDDSLSSDSDVIAINEAVRSSQGLTEYSSDMIVEVTWENVRQYGGSSSQVSVYILEDFENTSPRLSPLLSKHRAWQRDQFYCIPKSNKRLVCHGKFIIVK